VQRSPGMIAKRDCPQAPVARWSEIQWNLLLGEM